MIVSALFNEGNRLTTEQKQTTRKTLSLMAATFAVTFALMMMVQLMQPSEFASAQTGQTNVPMLSPDIDIDWRYTTKGWQQIGELHQERFAPIRTFESIHPFVWAATVMIAVVTTTVWASSEWEIARLHRHDE